MVVTFLQSVYKAEYTRTLLVFIFKRENSNEHVVVDHAKRPCVSWVIVQISHKYLRSHKIRWTAVSFRLFVFLDGFGQSKVSYFNNQKLVILFEVEVFAVLDSVLDFYPFLHVWKVDQNICRLQVSMHHEIAFDGWDAIDNLAKNQTSLFLNKIATPRFYVVLKVTTIAKLHQQIEVLFPAINVYNFYDIIRVDLA